MESDLGPVFLSGIDQNRFGVPIARATRVTMETLPLVMEFCRANGVVLLIARCPATEIRAAQAMEREGFALMDTLIFFSRELTRSPIPPDTGQIAVRPIQPGEADAVRAVAIESFRGYSGHYHADDRLDRAACDETYVSWAYRACVSPEVADVVLVADRDGSIVGFATLRLNNAVEGEGVLFGVAPSAQGRGVYRSFMVRGMEWCLAKGASRMVVSTQITNMAVQKIWARVGFEPSHGYYTFHKWFDGA